MWKNSNLDMLRTLTAARTSYEERFGWPVTIDIEPGRLVLTVGDVAGAVVMPRALGALVLADLRIALLAGPVLADTSGRWWMFLTRPANLAAPKHPAELRCLDVHPLPWGTRVVVPCEFGAHNGCLWIEQPRSLPRLPPWPAVISVARRLGAAVARPPTGQPRLRHVIEPIGPDVPLSAPPPEPHPERNDVVA